jgi:6-phosphofructokinase 1
VEDLAVVKAEDLMVATLGSCEIDSPILDLLEARWGKGPDFGEEDRMLFDDTVGGVRAAVGEAGLIRSFERAGPRRKIFFEPGRTRAGIVTCGGLCPGLNDVIRGLVMVLWHRYGVKQIDGFRYGYEGLTPAYGHAVTALRPEVVRHIHEDGGTILGSSRGPQDPAVMVEFLRSRGVDVLFVIGGDGTLRGGLAISQEAKRRGMKLSVVGVPKTIDNDVMFVEQSFGFQTAFSQAVNAIRAAHTEALGAMNGVGLVKLMGRHSGFIACFAAVACNDVNYVLIPEVPFPLEGRGGFLESLTERLKLRGHAVVVVAEGAGQNYCNGEGTDASGNAKLGDVGAFLKERIGGYLKEQGVDSTVKYIDPSYIIRSVPTIPSDSVYCFRLAEYAVHGAMAGKTEMVVGRWHNRFVYIPIEVAIRERQRVDPKGDLWMTVLEATGQPRWATGRE